MIELALLGVAGNDDAIATAIAEQAFRVVKPQVRHALFFIRAMTLEAGVRQDGTNVAVEVQPLYRRLWRGY